ncbi:MAG: DUF2953 domain-containing protein [Clostridiaceae bacterium]|nr:DUF2953 domain-containing protein [Clostridiaceae bacterium]
MKLIMMFLLVLFELLLLLLLIPAGIKIKAGDGFLEVYAKILGIGIKMYPPKKKSVNKKKKDREDKVADNEENKGNAVFKNMNFSRLMEYFSFASEAFSSVVRGLYVSSFKLTATIHNSDPAKTALMYGSACGTLGIIFPKLQRIFRIRKPEISLAAEFNEPGTFFFSATVLAIPGQLLAVAAIIYFKWKKLTKNDKVVQK